MLGFTLYLGLDQGQDGTLMDGRAGALWLVFWSGVPLFHNGPAGLVGDLVTARIRSRVVSQSQ